MGSTAQIPFSNSAGKNQFSPSTGGITPQVSGGIPGSPQAQSSSNPYMTPATASAAPIVSSAPTASPTAPGIPASTTGTSASNGFITSSSDGSQNALQKQLDDIYGQGVGGSLFSLLNNMSGTDSTVLQEYISSLAPQEASAQANTNAALGAGGVSANSSVAALADSNLQSQEFSSIASESASLTQSQEQLTAQLLSGTQNSAQQEVATSGWSVFGDVMNDITGDIGALVGGKGSPSPASQYASQAGGNSDTVSGSGFNIPGGGNEGSNSIGTGDENLYQLDEDETGEDAGAELAAFA